MIGTHATHMLLLDHSANRIGTFLPRDVSSVQWSRTKNEFTQAVTQLTADGSLVNDLEPWLHQLAVFRNDVPVWRGFVFRVEASGRDVTITARDPSVMFTKRRVAQDKFFTSQDLSYIASEVIAESLAAWDPFGLVQQMVVTPTGTSLDLTLRANESLVSEVLKDLVDAGLQWTVTGGRLVIGPSPRLHITNTLEDMHLDAAPTVVKDGSNQVNDLIVLGKGATGAYFDFSGGQTGIGGRLQGIQKADSLTQDWQCINLARRTVKGNAAAPRFIDMGSGSRLLPTAPMSLTELVPGVLVPVSTSATGVVLSSRMELTEVSVKASPGKDEVSITLGDEPVELTLPELLSPTRQSLDDV